MPFIGNQLSTSFQNVETQTITGDGSTSYTLNNAVADGKDLLVYINNVKQEEGSGKSYTATGTTITFTEAVASTDSCYVVFIGQAIGTVTPKDGSIVSSMLADANLEMPNTLDLNGKELILDADADTSITADTDDTIDIKIAGSDVYQITATKIDLNGKELVLDADADTSITADTDDQIDIRVGGSDLVKLTDSTLTLTSATASRPGIVLESTNADANPPFLRFQKNGSSPANNDEIAAVQFYADDDGGNVFVAGQIKVYSDNVSDGSEASSITFSNINAGSANNCMQFNPTETVFNESSVNRDFRVESDDNANMLFVDGGNNRVSFGANDMTNTVNIAASSSTAIGLTIKNTENSKSGELNVLGSGYAAHGANAGQLWLYNADGVTVGSPTGNSGGVKLVAGGSARVTVDSSGRFYVPNVYSSTTSSGANVNVASDGRMERSTSSRRYKNSIKDATHGLTDLLKLRSVTYKGNNDGDTIFGGLIAEEVHDAGLTEFVQYDDDGKPDALSYGNMVSLCVKAIQELEERIAKLESK
jgi:hypothetical protein